METPCKYFLSSFFFRSTLKVKGKKLKIFVFWKTTSTIFIKFSGFIVHSNLNYMTLSAIPGKSFKLEKVFFNLLPIAFLSLKPSHQSRSNSMYTILLQIFPAIIFVFDLPLKLRVVHIRTRRPLKVLKSCFCNRFPFCYNPYININRKLIFSFL